MKRANGRRLLSAILVLAMVISMVPLSIFAAESSYSWEKVELADITETDTVMITMTNPNGTTYALDASVTQNNPALVVTVDGTTITTNDEAIYGWTIKATEGVYHIMKGEKYLYTTNNNNGMRVGDTVGVWTLDGNYLKTSDGTNDRWLGVYDNNNGDYSAVASPNWRAYKNYTNNTKDQVVGFWKLTGSESYNTVAEALAASEGTFTVKGVVTLVDGSNVYVQDSTGGICVRMSEKPTDIALGDTIIGTGSKTVYNDLPQLGSATYEKSSGKTLNAKETTIPALSTADICTYVSLKGVTVTEVYDNNGAYSNPNITVTDGIGSIQLYKAAVDKNEDGTWAVQAGDKVDIQAAVSINKGTLQLRNTLGTEITASTAVDPDVSTDLPAEGAQVVIYNLSAKGVLAAQNDVESIENAAAEIVDGKAVPGNGGVIFTVSRNGDYFRFYNECYGYLCSYGTGNNAIYAKEASDDADWNLIAGKSGGFFMESRTAKFNGKYSQYLEYFAESYKTYSMNNVTDYNIYEFSFYEVAEDVNITEGIVNAPEVYFGGLEDAYVGTPYTFSFEVKAVFGLDGEATVKVGDTVLTANENGTYTIPTELIVGDALTITVSAVDTKGVVISAKADIAVVDEPSIDKVTPAANAQTGENKKPVISAEISNAGEDTTVTMTVNGETVEAVYADGVISYTPAADMDDGRVSVTVLVKRADGKEAVKTWSFTIGKATHQLYFGQLHSHTTYSDGSGSLESALDYVYNLPDSANVDFVAFTDHSNYFDTKTEVNPEDAMYDMSVGTAQSQKLWADYVSAAKAFNSRQGKVVAVPGFEMTWSGGPGHMNTFNTPGVVSRNNATLNSKTADAGLKAYYNLLSRPEGVDAIAQFNHPGTTFGTFADFAYYDAVIDSRIYLVEVGNGEGAVGAGGYFPSYEYYTMALDKGWHVAPTNNQDNHKGKWGNANDARDVILTDDFSLEGLYAAMRAMRMYATEDKNLEITYTLNDQQLGSIIEEVPEKLNLNVTVYDPDRTDSISKVEVIVNSGKVAYTWSDPTVLAEGQLSVELDPTYSYYYIRVTEGDGDLAVTAPVWVGESLKLGISSVVSGTAMPVTNEELKVTTTLFNSEQKAATIKSLVYTMDGKVVGTIDNAGAVPAYGTVALDFIYTPKLAKVQKLTVTAIMELNGEEYTFTMDLTLDVQDAEKLTYIGIDASHYNEYVSGNYKDSMGNFALLAADYNIRTVELKTSEELIAACSNPKFKALIMTAPSRRLAEAQKELRVYSDAEINAIKAFNVAGGAVILAGWSDHYEYYTETENMTPAQHMAATQNAVLEALGSSLRISDDATYDDSYNGGQAYRLYFNTYNFDNVLNKGVEVDPEHPHDRIYTEVFSQYGGASIYTVDGTVPSTVSPIVYGHSTTYSVDVDKDGLGGSDVPKYAVAKGDERLMVMASEQLEGQGLIIVSGAAFMSNFEVQATIEDSASEKNYSNYRICQNLCEQINPVQATPIAEVHAQSEVGYKYTIEGVVTSNASAYDKDTAFFDCVYVQDATGGICCFPVAGNYKIGDLVRVTGTTEFYQGEPELQVTAIEVIGEGTMPATEITASQLNDRSVEGMLVTVSGTVESFELANGLVQTIMVKDAAGNMARVFIDGYITIAEDVRNLTVGCNITATGLASYDDTFNAPEGPFPRIRVRNRADVVCTEVAQTVIDAPVIATSNNAKTGKIQVTWDAVEGAEAYSIYRATAKDGKYTKMYTTSNTTYTNTLTTAGEYYYYYVVAVAADGTKSAHSNIAGRTCDLPCPVVTASNNAKSGKICLTWDAVEGAEAYSIYRATAKDGQYTKMYTTSNTTYTNTTAEAGVTYYYKVVAVAAKTAANSAASSIVSRTCDLARPVVTVSNNAKSGKVCLTWDAVDGAEAYSVYRATSKGGLYTKMYTTSSTTYTNTTAEAGVTYYYKVVAVAAKSVANSASSSIVSRTCDLARPVVTASNNPKSGKVCLTWNAVEGAEAYSVYRASTKDGQYSKMYTTSNTTYTNTTAEVGVTYYYKVVAVAAKTAANSAPSSTVSRTCDLPQVKSVTGKLNQQGRPNLTWTPVEGAVAYKVYRAETENGKYELMKTTTGTSYTNTKDIDGRSYYYYVVAVYENTNGNSAPSKIVKLIVNEDAPEDIAILYTNDVHTYIDNPLSYDVIAGIKKELEKKYEYVLLMDAGDHAQGTAYGSMDKGQTIVELMNTAGYDLATLGNHEFDYGMDGAMNIIDWADYSYISSNFYHEKNGVVGKTVLPAYQLFDCGNETLAIVGITTPESFTKSTPAYFQDDNGNYIYGIAGGTKGKALCNAVQTAINDAKAAGATKVIALGHLGDDPSSAPWTSVATISNVYGLDAFIDGHSHSTVEGKIVTDKKGNKVTLTQTGEYFDRIGMMVIDGETGAITTDFIEYTETADGYALVSDLYTGASWVSDKDTAAVKNEWIAEIDEQLNTVIGTAKVTLGNYDANGKRLVRSQETNAGDFCADALYYLFDNMGLDVDVAIMNGGGIRNKAVTGELTYKVAKEIHTFGNVACLQTITGQQLLDALEWGARSAGTGEECGGFLQVAGITYDINAAWPSSVQMDDKGVWVGAPTGGYRVSNVQVYNKKTQAYEPLDLTASYNLAGYNYTLRDLGDGFNMFSGAVNVLDYVMEDYMVLANYIQGFENGVVKATNSPLAAKYAGMKIDYGTLNGAGRIAINAQ